MCRRCGRLEGCSHGLMCSLRRGPLLRPSLGTCILWLRRTRRTGVAVCPLGRSAISIWRRLGGRSVSKADQTQVWRGRGRQECRLWTCSLSTTNGRVVCCQGVLTRVGGRIGRGVGGGGRRRGRGSVALPAIGERVGSDGWSGDRSRRCSGRRVLPCLLPQVRGRLEGVRGYWTPVGHADVVCAILPGYLAAGTPRGGVMGL